MIRQASPAFSGSMPFKRNIIEGYSMLPALSPTSQRAPAQPARSPPPQHPIKLPARTHRRGPRAREEPKRLDQQGAAAAARRSHRGSDAGGPAAEDNDLIFAI